MTVKYNNPGTTSANSAGAFKDGAAYSAGDVGNFSQGAAAVTTNLSNAGTDLLGVVLGPRFAGNYGTSAGYAEHVINQTGTGYFDSQSLSPEVWLSGGGASNVINEIRIRPANPAQVFRLTSCTNAKTFQSSASLIVTSSVTLADMYFSGTASATIAEHSSDLVALLELLFGAPRVLLKRDWTTARVNAGVLTTDLQEPSGAAGGTLELRNGVWKPVYGNVGTGTLLGGIIDATELKGDVTVSAGTLAGAVLIKKRRNGPALTLSALTPIGGEPLIEYVD